MNNFVEELILRQKNLHERIEAYAKEHWEQMAYLGALEGESAPVYDGVIKPQEYAQAKPRILWILKEPRDCEKNGRYYGGGWQMFLDCDEASFNAKIASGKAYQTLFRVAQISYGVEQGLDCADAMNSGEEAVGVLRRIAYVNIGKMPGPATTPACRVKQLYKVWKPFVLEQIEMCKPDLIVCGGSGVLDNLAMDLESVHLSKPAKMYVGRSGAKKLVVDCHRWRGVPIVWTEHPSARSNKTDYFRCTLDACRGALRGDW